MLSSKSVELLPVKQVISQIKKTVSEFCISDSRNISLRDSFTKDLGMDSLDMVELFVMVEGHLKINLPEDFSQIKSVKQLTKECINKLKFFSHEYY